MKNDHQLKCFHLENKLTVILYVVIQNINLLTPQITNNGKVDHFYGFFIDIHLSRQKSFPVNSTPKE